MLLLKNDIILTKIGDIEEFERILWISEDNELCITITMNVNKLLFNKRNISDFKHLINEGTCELYTEDFGLDKLFDDYISPKSKVYRDKAYEIIKYIFNQDNEIMIFTNSKRRCEIIKRASKKFDVVVSVIYKYIRSYLQGGKLKNALLPKFNSCGAKGKDKIYAVKGGRKSYEEILTGKKRGVVLNDDIRNIFEVSISRYYKKDDLRTLTQTYELMIKDFFSEIIDGEIKILEEDKIPTFRQFENFYYKNLNLEDILRGRKGNKKFDLTMRALKSNSTDECFGPGFKYQIDATMADVYLVSRIDGKSVIGRPILYLLVDVFSRLIVGFFIGFEGPSWNGSASTIYNCTENKVELCKKYGINISSEMWPVAGLPEVLIADRGELVGPISNKAPWPCLNITADHYLNDVVSECIVTSDYKTRKLVGTFVCSCGFIYSRKGPDVKVDDRFKVGRIKQFGHIWEQRLIELINEEKYNLKSLSEKMNCDPKTIVKYANKLSVIDKINTIMKVKESNFICTNKDYSHYKE